MKIGESEGRAIEYPTKQPSERAGDLCAVQCHQDENKNKNIKKSTPATYTCILIYVFSSDCLL